ncbi:DEAD/DEAH box helicase family protein [Priestia flexa]|uniref:DEAD/DEAH box helicase family protein n=1 Tax=Priestia flexa TaxID=86664 RepID=UPI000473A344|nr:DEAD/DEAH box helicase family protein [Priestia flexa]
MKNCDEGLIKIPFTDIKEINPKKWERGDIISILSGAGTGKSWFVKEILYEYAKNNKQKILFLTSRLDSLNQFYLNILQEGKQNIVHTKTYQSIESLYRNYKEFDFSPYQYIVSDDCHYFTSDAAFNHTTDLSLEAILSQNNKTRIFMSATGDSMVRYLNSNRRLPITVYEKKISYKFIKDLRFFHKNETIESLMDEAIKRKMKTIFFIQSAKKAYELHQKYKKHSLFNCSKSNSLYKHVDKEKISKMLEDEKFEELILITTTCMDAGVNIHDHNLQHIVCDVKDIGTLIQCIGRKRLCDESDGIYLVIKSINNQQIGRITTELHKKRKAAKYLKDNGIEAYVEEYYRNLNVNNGLVYDEIVNGKLEKKINLLMYFRTLIDENSYSTMIKDFGEFAYCKYLANIFGYVDHDGKYLYTIIEEDERINDLEEYLKSIIGHKLYKEDQQKLIEMIGLKDKRGRIQRRIDTLNAYLLRIKSNYTIIPKKSGSIRYWELNANLD